MKVPVIDVAEHLRPAIEAAIDTVVIDPPLSELFHYREQTTRAERIALSGKLDAFASAMDEHRILLEQLDAGWLPLAAAMRFVKRAADDETDELVEVACKRPMDVARVQAVADRLGGLLDLYARAQFDASRFGEPRLIEAKGAAA